MGLYAANAISPKSRLAPFLISVIIDLMNPQLKKAFHQTLPVLFGYIPLGMAFGLLFDSLGHPWYFASLSGLLIFAGAAQFLSIGLLANKTGLFEIFVTTFVLNLRHIFYGFSLFHRFRGTFLARFYLIFGLTDETYSVLTSSHYADTETDHRYCFYVTLINHSYWVLGCTLGALLGKGLVINTQGFEFVLTALFTVLMVEQALAVRRFFPFVLALVSAIIAFFFYPKQILLVSLVLVFISLIAYFEFKGEKID